MVHSSSAANVFYWLISFLQEEIQLSFSISQDLDLMTCPLSSQPSLSGQFRAATPFSHISHPIFALNCLLLSPAVNIFCIKSLGTAGSARHPKDGMLKNPGRKYPTEQGGFLSDLIETWRLHWLPVKLCLLVQPYPFQQSSLNFLQELLWN